MKRLLLLLPLLGLLASCKSPTEILVDAITENTVNSIKVTGSENTMLSELSTMDAQVAAGDKKLACSMTIVLLESTAIAYDDISEESMEDLREYQRLCGRRVFR